MLVRPAAACVCGAFYCGEWQVKGLASGDMNPPCFFYLRQKKSPRKRIINTPAAVLLDPFLENTHLRNIKL